LKSSLISIDGNRYSVPDKYAQKAVTVKLYPNKIIVYEMKTKKKQPEMKGFIRK